MPLLHGYIKWKMDTSFSIAHCMTWSNSTSETFLPSVVTEDLHSWKVVSLDLFPCDCWWGIHSHIYCHFCLFNLVWVWEWNTLALWTNPSSISIQRTWLESQQQNKFTIIWWALSTTTTTIYSSLSWSLSPYNTPNSCTASVGCVRHHTQP